MANSVYSKAVDKLTGSVSKAFDIVRTSEGETNDKDLMLYNTLTPDDFAQISKDFGPDFTVNYIQTMEKRRMTQGG